MTAKPQLIVFPASDLDGAKRRFTSLLGAEPYVDQPYYVGYRTDGREIGLDPSGYQQRSDRVLGHR